MVADILTTLSFGELLSPEKTEISEELCEIDATFLFDAFKEAFILWFGLGFLGS